MTKPIFSDEAYQMAAIAVRLCAGKVLALDIEAAVNWAVEIVTECDVLLKAKKDRAGE